MAATILKGKPVAEKIREDLAQKAAELAKKVGRPPGLAAILVGEDPASQVYVSMKHKACQEAGFHSELIQLEESIPQEELLKKIRELNRQTTVDGILVQLPLPKHLNEEVVLEAVAPEKDVDGFHPQNQGKLLLGLEGFVPATPKGVMRMLSEAGVALKGKHAVVVGRSNIVGKPLALLLLREDATVTICHSKTKKLEEITRQADVLVAAVGKAGLITEKHVKDGAVVIDVGTTREKGRLRGDVDFDSVVKIASLLTPVPGGVGPMTIALLLENTFWAYQKRNGLQAGTNENSIRQG
ncbi:bifunctional methylenetetrahydrofolate dehydrogenase/methenyltetrahydrofolate cyclohydrolase FolD [Candidatus Micrarchaeota archaeon]|nr:bifunctional methylenetetrahydrofolate dehydrogenase/methenyltetrahydrofolate cyclohydrolase FolD [Candidatus Micrarchaeota archaeon]